MGTRKLNKRIIIAIILSASLLVDIVILIIMIPTIRKNTQDLQEYRVNEESNTMYQGLIKYIGEEAEVFDIDGPKTLRSLQFEDQTLRLMTLTEEDTPIYVEIETHKSSVDEALQEFIKNEVKYNVSFQIDEWGEKEINIDKYVDGNRVALTTENGGNTYMSFTAQYDKDHYCSLTRAEYKNDGDYVTTTIVSPQKDKILCDFYYLIINN